MDVEGGQSREQSGRTPTDQRPDRRRPRRYDGELGPEYLAVLRSRSSVRPTGRMAATKSSPKKTLDITKLKTQSVAIYLLNHERHVLPRQVPRYQDRQQHGQPFKLTDVARSSSRPRRDRRSVRDRHLPAHGQLRARVGQAADPAAQGEMVATSRSPSGGRDPRGFVGRADIPRQGRSHGPGSASSRAGRRHVPGSIRTRTTVS